jgi:hypothetical protein
MSRFRSRLRLAALWLALAGVLLRGLVPAGFMPGWTQAGTDGSRSWLMVCPAGELATLLPADPHAHHHHMQGAAAGDDHDAHRIGEAHLGCPFAAVAAPALPSAATTFLAISRPTTSAVPFGSLAPPTSDQRRLPPARAPPVSAV